MNAKSAYRFLIERRDGIPVSDVTQFRNGARSFCWWLSSCFPTSPKSGDMGHPSSCGWMLREVQIPFDLAQGRLSVRLPHCVGPQITPTTKT